MDEFAILGAAATLSAGIAGWLLGRRREAIDEKPIDLPLDFVAPAQFEQHPGLPYEVEGRQFSPRRDHKHEFTVMVGDGWGWRCGVVTDGIECGRPKEGRRAI